MPSIDFVEDADSPGSDLSLVTQIVNNNLARILHFEIATEFSDITYPEIINALSGKTLSGKQMRDLDLMEQEAERDKQGVLFSLKDAWKTLQLENYAEINTTHRLKQYNSRILRGYHEHISGVGYNKSQIRGKYCPSVWLFDENGEVNRALSITTLPQVYEADVEDLFAELKMIDDPQKRAIYGFFKFAKLQPFADGNKRTAQFYANAILCKHKIGLFYLKPDKFYEQQIALHKYYNNLLSDTQIYEEFKNNIIPFEI